jgi:ATP/maltotriose-dependent transcriptional regulator MalT/DNA-binding SARP family transcriptional activator
MIPVTRTKILLPRRPTSLLTRPRLIELVDGYLDSRLILITAPAGYGKTSLLIDLARQIEMPVCWYALDALDRDPQRFAAHLIASIAQEFPSFGHESAAALGYLTAAESDLDRLVTTIVNEAYDHIEEHFVVILDDYHLVNNSDKVNRFVSQFIQNMDENCHLVLSSRTLLSLPDLPLMVARSQVGGLDYEELAFSADEIRALALQNHALAMSESDAQALVAETEGWITGMLLSTRTVWYGLADRVRVARASGVGLYDYLAQQILEQQPADVHQFLLQSSLLEEFDASRCLQVFGPDSDWQRLIDYTLTNGLFVLPVEDGETWLRYHHLFRDFLQDRMAENHPDEMKRILTRLATVLADEGEWEEAHRVHLRLGDVKATADLIERAAPPLMKSGRPLLLAEWIDQLPPGMLDTHPGLLSARGDAAVMLGDVTRGLIWLNQAVAALGQCVESEDNARLARTLVRRAVAHRFLGQYQSSLDDAIEASDLVEQDENMQAVLAGAWRGRGIALLCMGQLDAAVEWLERSLATHAALGNTRSAALLLNDLGLAFMNAGRIALALDYYQRSLDFWLQDGNLFRQATILNNLGVLYHLRGDYEQALTFLNRSHQTAEHSGYLRMAAIALAGIGDLIKDLSAPDLAREAYRQARVIALKLEDQNQLRYLALADVALARADGETQKAEQLMWQAADGIEAGGSGYERGLWQLEAGRLALAAHDIPRAKLELAAAAENFEHGGQQIEAAHTHFTLATACHQNGERPACLEHLSQAFRLAASPETQHTLVVPALCALPMLREVQRDPILGSQVVDLLQRVTDFESEIPVLRRKLRRQNLAVPIPPPRLTVETLGLTRVRLDGKPVAAPEWQSRRAVREFFFLMLAHPEGLSKEAIGDILWSDASAAQIRLRFKNTIYRLRRALGPELILFDGNLYRFNQELDYDYDVELLISRVEQARSTSDLSDRIATYQEAIDLYQGPYLPEAEGIWVHPRREELCRIFHEAADRLADCYLQIGDHERALDTCNRILADDACHEKAHCTAMRVHAASGNRAAVVRQFEACRRHLSETLGTSPSPQTFALYRTLTGTA